MNAPTPEAIAAALKACREEPAPPWLLAQAAQFIADELAAPTSAVSAAEVRCAMKVLNKFRHFELTCLIGEAWVALRGCDAVIHKCLAQALIELGKFENASKLLDEACSGAEASPDDPDFKKELPEYRGLRGRILKQQFIHGGQSDMKLLRAATDAYLAQFELGQNIYHGVNGLALLLLEQRLELPPRAKHLPDELADHILRLTKKIQRQDPSNPWPFATAAEVCLALDQLRPDDAAAWCDQAELSLHRLLGHLHADPFVIESYHRQLREIWGGDMLRKLTCADRLSDIVERHVMRTERRWSVDASQARELAGDTKALEKNFGGDRTFGVKDLQSMIALCANIGCVTDVGSNVRLGTGFLLKGMEVGFDNEPFVFVTNAHVVSGKVPQSLAPEAACVTFEMEPEADRKPHKVDRILFTSEPGNVGQVIGEPTQLDVTILKLRTWPRDLPGLTPSAHVPLPSASTKVFVVGHPRGGMLQFSLSDCVLMDVCDFERLLHYRTPTEPGSSGSPVFNTDWEVIALHHAGSQTAPRLHGKGEYQANEGISLNTIRQAVRNERLASPPGDQ